MAGLTVRSVRIPHSIFVRSSPQESGQSIVSNPMAHCPEQLRKYWHNVPESHSSRSELCGVERSAVIPLPAGDGHRFAGGELAWLGRVLAESGLFFLPPSSCSQPRRWSPRVAETNTVEFGAVLFKRVPNKDVSLTGEVCFGKT